MARLYNRDNNRPLNSWIVPIEDKARAIAADHDLLDAITKTGLRLPKRRRLRDIIDIAIQYPD